MMRPTPLATLAALTALTAAAALAPTPAAAVINNSGTAGCAAPHPGDQVYWSNGSWCVVQEGAGWTAGTGTGAGNPLTFWAQSDAPKDLPSECLHKNAGACMPTQRGGREVQEAKDGPIAGSRGSGSKAAGKSETGRGKARPSKEECEKLRKGGALLSPFKGDLLELELRIRKLDDQVSSLGEGKRSLSNKLSDKMYNLPGFDRWAPEETFWDWLFYPGQYYGRPPATVKNFTQRLSEYHTISVEIIKIEKEIQDIMAKRNAAEAESEKLRTEAERVRVEGKRATEIARAECAATYGNRQ